MGRLQRLLQRRAFSRVEGIPLIVHHEIDHRPLREIGLLVEHETASGDRGAERHDDGVSHRACVRRLP